MTAWVSVAAVLALASLAVGCNKKVDPYAFDGGAAPGPAASVAPSAPEATASGAAPEQAEQGEIAPLASLTPTKPAPVAAPAKAKASASGAHPADKPVIEECEQAKQTCGQVGRVSRTLCAQYRAECLRKGGSL